jgi:predicted PurR-regulated permease PerM
MNQMMNHTGGWVWVWPVMGVLAAVVLVIVIKKLFKK